MNKSLLFLSFFLFSVIMFSQSHISGAVTLDIEKGYMHCDFTLANLPGLSDYKILLNHGMNIKFFKDEKNQQFNYEGFSNGKTRGEALEYYFVDAEDQKMNLPSSFKIEYSGAFPVYKDSFNAFDFKGYIAINGKTLRATEQTKWYPVLYDSKNDKFLDSYTYEITIKTSKQKSVFINGSAPQTGIKTVLSSQKAVPLLLFAGDYEYTKVDGNYLMNTDVDETVAAKIFSNIDSIKGYYGNLLNIEFKDDIYVFNHKAVKEVKNEEWGFNTYPAFGFSNLDFNTLLDEDDKFRANRYKFFAHELAHNYFGNNVNSGLLFWFWLESTTEYLSLIALEDYSTSENVFGYYNHYIKAIEDKDFIPLDEITESKQIDFEYRYLLGPLIYKAFEISFGKEKTFKTLKSLLELSEMETLTIESWEKAAVGNGISKASFSKFKQSFLSDKKFKENLIEFIRNYRNNTLKN